MNKSKNEGRTIGKIEFYDLFYENAKKQDEAFIIQFNKVLDMTRAEITELYEQQSNISS